MDQEYIKRVVEALIFASDEPLSTEQIRICIDDVQIQEIDDAINLLIQEYSDIERAFFLKKVSGGYQFATKPEYFKWIKRLYEGRIQHRLSRAALEALAIIAFKQPVSKVEVSAIRGVNSDGVIKSLLLRRLVALAGRSSGPGRPLLYGTTPEFLKYFGLNSLDELPKLKEIEELLADGEGAAILYDFAASENKNPESVDDKNTKEAELATQQELQEDSLPPTEIKFDDSTE